MAEKRDLLGECNELGVTAQDFEVQFCFRCLQAECARSQHGKSRFEARIGSWEERLFKHVPRMNESDPRFVVLRTKKFVDIDAGRVPEIGQGSSSAWVDPRDLDEAPKSPQSTASSETVEAPEPPLPLPEAPASSTVSESVETTEPSPAPPRALPQLMNTPVQQGRMIGGHKLPPPRDPWEAPASTKETQGLQVVKPAARIKISGSGV